MWRCPIAVIASFETHCQPLASFGAPLKIWFCLPFVLGENVRSHSRTSVRIHHLPVRPSLSARYCPSVAIFSQCLFVLSVCMYLMSVRHQRPYIISFRWSSVFLCFVCSVMLPSHMGTMSGDWVKTDTISEVLWRGVLKIGILEWSRLPVVWEVAPKWL